MNQKVWNYKTDKLVKIELKLIKKALKYLKLVKKSRKKAVSKINKI